MVQSQLVFNFFVFYSTSIFSFKGGILIHITMQIVIFAIFSHDIYPPLQVSNIEHTKLLKNTLFNNEEYIKNVLLVDFRRYHMLLCHLHKNKKLSLNHHSVVVIYQSKSTASKIQQKD